MADISDVTAALATLCAGVLYPSGVSTSGQVSSLGIPAKIFEGWPVPEQLNADMQARVVNVSVYPVPGTTQALPQVVEAPFVIVPAVHGMTPSINSAGTVVTVSGTPTTGEYLSLIVNGNKVYSRSGASLAAILTALLADVQIDFASATATTTTITIPGIHSLIVRVGAVATMGMPIHRQADQVMISIWAPDPASRSLFASNLDVALKTALTVTLPDTTQGVLRYQRTNITDHEQNRLIYRRDLIYAVEYLTVEQFPAYEVTSITLTTSAGSTTVS